ncbi:hypothetical protein [Peribacillus frigoritolerans]|uniref:hypothetical protein n=1 Tax=Peribacillus castrilensis TaxID=2897690 RepID=UPI00296EC28F|nr:hypothetical protein [Peribacillus castrilensis]
MEGFKQAFAYYNAIGISSIIFPKGLYPMCFRNPTGGEFYNNVDWEIKLPSNMVIDFGGSTIKIIYDSLNRNPYDKSTREPWKLSGRVFAFDKTENTTIKNGILIGDRYDRAYTAETTSGAGFNNEQGQDQSYGIYIKNGSLNGNIIDMTICGFMGDSITGIGTSNNSKGTDIVSPVFYPGYIHTDGTVKTDIAGAYCTDMLDVNSMKGQIMLATNVGYTRVPDFKNQIFDISFFDSSNTFISMEKSEHLNVITMPLNTKYIRISIFGEVVGQPSMNKVFRISTLQSSYFHILRCNIFDNNRGGLSNLPHDVTVENCNIYDCGQGLKMYWKRFPDTTRYAINCEDTVTRRITIKNNSIRDVGSAFLFNSKEAVLDGNKIYNVEYAILGLYYASKVFFKNNSVFDATWLVDFNPITTSIDRSVFLEGNIIKDCKTMYNIRDNRCFIHDSNNINETSEGFDVKGGHRLKMKLPVQRKPSITFSDLTGEFINCKLDVKPTRYSTSEFTLGLTKHSSNNVFNISNYFIRGNYSIYNTYLNGGSFRSQVATENNLIQNSTIIPYLIESEYYTNANTNRSSTMNKTTLNDANLSAAHFITVLKNGTPAGAVVLSDSYVFEDCIIEINKPATLRLFNIAAKHSTAPFININITFKNCKFVNTTRNTIALANVDSAFITKVITGCEFVGAFGFTNINSQLD